MRKVILCCKLGAETFFYLLSTEERVNIQAVYNVFWKEKKSGPLFLEILLLNFQMLPLKC